MSDLVFNMRSMRTTQRKGDIATSRAVATFTARGFDVSIPLTESAAYDWLYVLAADGSEYLIEECLYGRRSVNLRTAHRLGAVAESG
jgi:hypothetical protein